MEELRSELQHLESLLVDTSGASMDPDERFRLIQRRSNLYSMIKILVEEYGDSKLRITSKNNPVTIEALSKVQRSSMPALKHILYGLKKAGEELATIQGDAPAISLIADNVRGMLVEAGINLEDFMQHMVPKEDLQ